MGDDLFCYALRDHAAILCDGTVIPCCLDSEGNIALGNVFSSSLKEILSSDRARALVNGFNNKKATEDLCRRCGYARRFSI
jgi:radical SAM protein with 4Fe4S-binding SPASM domain